MKTEKPKKLIRWYILGAIGAVLMATGDWLLGCVPLQAGDTGMFNRAYYLSGSYGLWRPVLTVGLGAIGGFLYYFVVKALNADIDEKYRKKYAVSVWDIHRCNCPDHPCMGGHHGMVCHLSGAADRSGGRACGGHDLSGRNAPRNSSAISSDAVAFRHPFCNAACRKNALSEMDACVSSGHMESSAGRSTGYCAGDADAGGYMDVRDEPEQHEQRHPDLVHHGCGV